MKTRTMCMLLLVLILIAAPAAAKVWRVDSNTSNQADFRTLNDANASANVISGDTLYVAGSTKSYGDVTLTKKLYIVGPGYFLGENPDSQANLTDAYFGNIYFGAGSGGSSLTGMSGSSVHVNTDGITIKRNKLNSIFIGSNANVSNTIVIQNYISTSSNECIGFNSTTNGTIISNNIILQSGGYRAIRMNTTATATVTHNVIQGKLELYNADFHSNILFSGELSISINSALKFNICNDGQFGTSNNNKTVADMTTVFISTGSTDGKWQLKDGSPAKSAGLNNEDCGAFGGSAPYVLSGIPAIPAIYQVNAPGVGSAVSGIPVNVKVKSRN